MARERALANARAIAEGRDPRRRMRQVPTFEKATRPSSRSTRRIRRLTDCAPPVRACEARSTAPRGRIKRPRGGRGVAELKWAIRRLAVRDGRSRSGCCESVLDAFTLAVQCGGCGVLSCDSGREPGFGAPRLPALRFVRTAREIPSGPRLQRHAPRLGGSMSTGCFPVAAWPQESTWQPPRRLTWMSLHRIRCGPSCLWRGVCLRDIAILR